MFGFNKPSNTGFGLGSQGNTSTTGSNLFSQQPASSTAAPGTQSTFGGSGGGLFGQQKPSLGATNPPTGGLFSQSTTAAPTQGTQGTAPSGGLFGQTQQQPAGGLGGGLFGNKPPTGGSTGLFGSSQPSGTGLFGQAQPSSTTNQPSTGLFGQAQPSSTTNQPSTGLFGQPQPSTAPGTGLLGQSQPTTQPSGGLFGQKPAQQTGLFGQSLSKPTTSLFGSTASQQPNTQPLSTPSIHPTTRYSSLDANVQKFLDDTDKEIFTQIQLAEELQTKSSDIAELVDSVPLDITEVERRLSSVSTALLIDSDEMELTKKLVDKDTTNARISSRILDLFKTPGAIYPYTSNDPLVSYFEEFVTDADERTRLYASTIGELEQHLEQVETTPQNNSPEALLRTIKEEHKLFMVLSNRFAQVHDEVKRLQVNNTTAPMFLS
ncbi:nucleoporin Nup45 [Schizosaccharomyces cryophilus OY26]|uniref:Nucleoporin Nup45 n=1 Tax=Schizosaccharomyces cryophilus (strain OY26 / ATCC MYA-4695 / CBS 11777 / NBRC 106824 / NRRL Y48691) TaxID=653667 RepID=S9W692_SCHCR|nr:nucleoporin Nup45 [Schizosaccharomyces cryophilus OY26]EPY54084.1 nucleoporin Nup45 [Schizosaccharomyces cryophilus OY26]